MPPKPAASDALAERLRQRIAETGPLSLADFMQTSLTDPQSGYYAARQPIGRGGDFITAPEVSQVFGELIGLWTVAVWQSMGTPEIVVAELGPGRGTLMRDALRAWRNFPEFVSRLRICLVETSPALRELQHTALERSAACGAAVSLSWHETIGDLPPGPLIVLANELLDALPIRQFVRRGSSWQERMIGLDDGGGFSFVERPVSGSEAGQLCHLEASAEDGDIAELRPAVAGLLDDLSRRAASNPLAALFIDYGAEASGFGDTLQSVRGHRFVDPLSHPGEADLTAHVDFQAMKNQAEIRGLSAYGPMLQGAFLLKLGLAERQERLLQSATPDQRPMLVSGANRLIDPQQMGALFKVLAVTGADLPAPPPFPPKGAS
jgi:NADH dehydrogenase [ubiquinone] 1 alpha subcomplex assembly factor 7